MARPDWSEMTYGQKVDVIRPLLVRGLTYGQIARAFENATKNSVLGFCHRTGLNRANAGTFVLPEGKRDYRVAPPGKIQPPRGPSSYRAAVARNDATDPETHALVEEINASGFYAYDIAEVAGFHADAIRKWRHGHRKARRFSRQCVRDAIRRLRENPWLRRWAGRPMPGEVLSGMSEMTCDTAKR